MNLFSYIVNRNRALALIALIPWLAVPGGVRAGGTSYAYNQLPPCVADARHMPRCGRIPAT